MEVYRNWFKKNIIDRINGWSNYLKDITTLDLWYWIFVVLFTIGLIIFVYFASNNSYSAITPFILWTTFIAILWYSKETYCLKKVQQKSLKQQRIRDNYEIMPFLKIEVSYVFKKFIIINNDGRGLAKNIDFHIIYNGKNYIRKFESIPEHNLVELEHIKDHGFLTEFGSLSEEDRQHIKIEVTFEDIANRKYKYSSEYTYNNGVYSAINIVQGPVNWSLD